MERPHPENPFVPSAEVHEARRLKSEFLGESKIEKGLRDFRIYRVSSARKLLDLNPRMSVLRSGVMPRILNRALFFTTQKNMAMEYRDSVKKPVLLEAKGLDFLETARNLEDQGVRVVLLTHDELPVYQKMMGSDEGITQEDVENFFDRHTLDPSSVSPRMLRAAAEIIVLLPEGLDRFPLRVKSRSVTGVRHIYDKVDEHGHARRSSSFPGQFHGTIMQVRYPKKPDQESVRLKRHSDDLKRKKDDVVFQLGMLPKPTIRDADLKQRLELERKMEELSKAIADTDRTLFEIHLRQLEGENVSRRRKNTGATASAA